MSGQTDGWTDGWTDGQTDRGRTDRWMVGQECNLGNTDSPGVNNVIPKQMYLKRLPKVSELLVGDGLDGRGVDGSGAVLGGQGKGILSHNRLASTGVGSHKDRMALFQMQNCLLLKGVQLKWEVVCQVWSQPMQQRLSGFVRSQTVQPRLSDPVPDAAWPLFGRDPAQRGSCVPDWVPT